jgi:hypothetical protein
MRAVVMQKHGPLEGEGGAANTRAAALTSAGVNAATRRMRSARLSATYSAPP